MDYKGHVCPVCHKVFENGEDIVVCPDCGTPHHRDCYESNGNCANANRHRENYDYKRECEVNSDVCKEELTCAFCGGKNPVDSRFCNSCGKPMNIYHSNEGQPDSGSAHSDNHHGGFGGAFVIDPLGGVKPDEEIADGVKASDAAKFVRTSTPFYIPQFKQIKERNKARFSFVGFIFGGGWMLYRKMYVLGAIFTALFALFTLAEVYTNVYHKEAVTFISEQYMEVMGNVAQNYNFDLYGALKDFFASLNQEQLIICISRTVISVLMILIRVICGVCGNRWYYKHCVKSISKLKQSSADDSLFNEKLSAKGGVNIPLAISLIASYYILIYLPMFI